jgi:glutamate synthase (NADPH) small chain
MMDQLELRRLENQCIQENLPECTAACPLHIDVRAFIGRIAQGNWAESIKVLRRTMPLTNILGRICDAPCEERCKRREAGEAIRIGALERACVKQKAALQRTQRLPANGKRVAVVGSGLSSLTVAWDCIRKGYDVRIFEPGRVLGETLRTRYQGLLPQELIEEETALLTELGVEIELEVGVDESDFPNRCLKNFEALYLGLDALPLGLWELEREEDGRIRIEPNVQRTSREEVFAGGLTRQGRASPVWQAAEGRWAATSIDRYLQKVSLIAGREKEGPVSTRLFTSLVDVIPGSAVKMSDPLLGYNNDEAVQEAQRCIQCQCLECVKVCVYLERFGSYPKKYAREIYNNESIVLGSHQANKLINSCSLCGLCEAVCPEDFAMQDLCLQTRQSMVRRGKMPPSAHEFALQDMAFSRSDRFVLARHGPGLSASAQAFFPGCQLCGSAPDKILPVYEHLQSVLSGGVGLILGCCSAPAHWAGRQEQFTHELDGLKGQWRSLGEPRLILACSTCLRMFKDHLPEIPVISLWEVLDKVGEPSPLPMAVSEPLAIHDPCTTRSEPDIQSAVRHLLGRLGVPIEELTLSREKTECCGFGGLQQNANPELAREVVRRRGQRSSRDYLTYCAMCRDSLASTDKRALHLLDLIFPDPQISDPAARKRPGWSERQENRSRLKDYLLKTFWSEGPMEKEEHQKIQLQIGPEVRILLEKRRILDEDLQKVVYHAERTGEKFCHPETGRLKASFRPYKATFWVEYGPSDKGFVIYNAYCHRMELAVS